MCGTSFCRKLRCADTSCKCCCRCHLPVWVQAWLVVSGIICTFDVVYTMFRPHTMPEGDMEHHWNTPWAWYSHIDLRYNETSDVVTMATGRVMIVEIVLNFVAVLVNYIPIATISCHSVVIAFTTTTMVMWKTAFYLTMYICPPEGSPSYMNPEAHTGWVVLFWMVNSVWVVVPLLVMARLWPKLAGSVREGEKERSTYYAVNKYDREMY